MKNNKYTFTRSRAVETYKLRYTNPAHLWADISVENGLTKGKIIIMSSYGTFSNYWNACNISFKDFLIKTDEEYLMKSFSNKNVFAVEDTSEMILLDIQEYYKQKEVHYTEALSCELEIENYPKSSPEYILTEEDEVDHDKMVKSIQKIKSHSSNDLHSFIAMIPSWIKEKIYDNNLGNIPFIYDYPSDIKLFMEYIWPDFIDILKDELK